jgi:hypothetical protein
MMPTLCRARAFGAPRGLSLPKPCSPAPDGDRRAGHASGAGCARQGGTASSLPWLVTGSLRVALRSGDYSVRGGKTWNVTSPSNFETEGTHAPPAPPPTLLPEMGHRLLAQGVRGGIGQVTLAWAAQLAGNARCASAP